MSVFTSPLISAGMPRRDSAASKNATEPVNLRLKVSTKEKLEAYRDRWPLSPTMTAIIEAALADWFAKHPLDEPPSKPAK